MKTQPASIPVVIICSFIILEKSLSAYTILACADEESPDDLEVIVDEGLDAIYKLFDV